MKLNVKNRRRALSNRGPRAAKQSLQQNGIIASKEIVDGALSNLASRHKLQLTSRPTTTAGEPLDPLFPTQLADVPLRDLGNLLGEFTAMEDYALGVVAYLDVTNSIEKHNEKVQTELSVLAASGRTVREREAKARTSAASSSRSVLYYQRVAEYKLSQAVLQGFTEKKKAISRELTRRETLVAAKLST